MSYCDTNMNESQMHDAKGKNQTRKAQYRMIHLYDTLEKANL